MGDTTTNSTMDMVTTPYDYSDNLNQFFLILMGMIVFFMQCGFAFLEAGAVRSKNVTNILIKNVSDSFISGIGYWLLGYAFAYGEGNSFIGGTYFASKDLPGEDFAKFFFQYTFAATAATIVSGAVAERCEFFAYFIYSICISAFIYPVVTHWGWSDEGFLVTGSSYDGIEDNVGYVDFAGSGLVHVLGGTAAFVGAAFLGPRIGRFHAETKSPQMIRGHSIPIVALGGFILFFGFLAFNGGSQLSITGQDDGEAVGLAVVNSIISASFAAFAALFVNRIAPFGNRKWSLLVTINGALTGMVAACAGCNAIHPWGSAILGAIAGLSYHLFSYFVRSLKVDDPLDAVAVHFGGGVWGVLALAFLHKEQGILLHWNKRSGLFLGWQIAGLLMIILWTAVLSSILFGILKFAQIFRVHKGIELSGLDVAKHDEPAYPVEAYGHGNIEAVLQMVERIGAQKVIDVLSAVEKRASTFSNGGTDNRAYDIDEGPANLRRISIEIPVINNKSDHQTEL